MNNILFIMADQLRHDVFGFSGKFPVKTPNIDALAKRGTTFHLAHTPNPVCVPARACLMTGTPSYENGVYYNDQNWPRSMPTWAQEFSDNCYYTACIGKTHFHPKRRGAGFHKLILTGDHGQYLRNLGMAKKKNKEDGGDAGKTKDPGYVNKAYPITPTDLPLEHEMQTWMTDMAIHELDLISQRRECGPAGFEPFVMKLSYTKPHSPCNPPEPFFSMYQPEDLPPPAASQEEIAGFPQQVKHAYDIWSQLEPERARRHRAQYMGCVSLIDSLIGRVIQKLKDLGLYDNTLIILTADHGDQICDHHLQQKGYFWEASVRVPLIFAGPGVAADHHVHDPVSLIDLYPTMLDFGKLLLEKRRDSQGRLIYVDTQETNAISLLPYLSGQDGLHADRIIVSENAIHGQRIMVRKRNIKINHYLNNDGSREWDYFDLDKDPDELDNRGKGFTWDDMPADMRKVLENVIQKSSQFASGSYYFQDKVRPMFT